jgi:plasmid maintenance system antidote protein VapI
MGGRHQAVKTFQARYVGLSIAQELATRHWTARELARRMDVPGAVVLNLLGGGVITRPLAAALARALGTTADLWLEADAEYREAASRRQGY